MVPEIASIHVRKGIADCGYGVIGTTPVIDDTAKAFEELVEEIIRSTEIETTRPRGNALEFKGIRSLISS